MKDITITITNNLKDKLWGFSDLLGERDLTDITKKVIVELLQEDIIAVLDGADWDIKITTPTGVEREEGNEK